VLGKSLIELLTYFCREKMTCIKR